MNNTNNNFVALIAVLGVIGIVIVGASIGLAFGFGTLFGEGMGERISLQKVQTVTQEVSQELGKIIHPVQELYPAGLIIGTKTLGQSGVQQIIVDGSNNLYIGSSTDANFKMATDGTITLKNVNLATSSLNWGADFSAGDGNDFKVDITNQRVGIGTSTPSYRLEIVDAADAVLAITATSTGDTILRFNNGYQAAEWLVYMDNSDGDKFKIGTSSDLDLFVIDEYGRIGIGTSSPQTSLAIVEDNIDPTIRITSAGASEYDPKIEFRTDLGTSSLVMYVDDSDSDRIVFGTSTDLNLLTIDRWGNVAVLKGLAMATGTISGTLVVSGNTTLATTTVGRFVESGLVLATSSYGNGIITATEVCNGARINATIMVPTANLTLPSTSTLAADCLSAVGKSITFQIKNASTSSSLAQYTIVKGDGIDLRGTSTDNVHLDPTEIMEIKLFRETDATTTASQRLIRQAD